MSEANPTCPHCGSARTAWKAKSRVWECLDCEERFDAAPPADLHDPLATVEDAFAQRARALAESPAWVPAIVDAWPAPIAHTYALLRQVLRDGQIDAAGLVLKDLIELLARFSTLALGSGLRTWGSDAQQAAVVAELFGKPLSMGDWVRLADGWAAQVLGVEPSLPVVPLAGMWRRTPTRQTAFGQWIAKTVQWRNEAIGHGVRGADLGGMMQDLERLLGSADDGLHGVLRPYAQLWEGLTLQDASGRSLMGSQAVLDDTHAQGHALDAAQPLHLQGAGWTLDLAPFLSARRCQVCGKSETFHYDSTDARKRVPDFRLLNYESGHAYKISMVLDDNLRACFDAAHPARAVEAVAGFDADALPQEIADMLEAQSVERSYLSPGYLRHPLQAFIESRRESGRGGAYWLRAPAHVGKSTFVRGLDPQYRDIYKDEALDAGLAVAVFYIRREYQFHLAQFAEQLRERLKMAYGLQAQNKPLPSLDLEHPGPQAFAAFLGAFQALGRRPLLVVIDGLDELAQESPSIADYLPGPDDLPAEVFVLLTSRPQADLPAWLQPRLARLQAASGREIGLGDADYVDLMRAYAQGALKAGRERLKGEARDRVPQFTDALMAQLLQASDGRFLYLHFLVDRLADGDLPAHAVQDLPRPEELVPQYLWAILKRYANTAQADLMRRTLHLLAITERAFELHQEGLSVLVRQPWRGLPLTLLSLFVEGAPRVTPRLASCLYLLKPLLGTWRGDDDARYRLGIKGLDEVVRGLDPQGYAQTAQRLVAQLLEDGSGQSGSDGARSAELDWVARHIDGVADLLEASALDDLRAEGSPALHALLEELAQRARAAAEASRHAEALGLVAAAEGICRWLAASEQPEANLDLQVLLPWLVILNARGQAESASGDKAAALASYGRAVAIWEALQARLGEQFTPDMQSGQAGVYVSQGNAFSARGDQAAASESYGRAITLLEALQERLGEQFTPDMLDSLAIVYSNQGVALSAQGEQAAALASTGRAIAIWEALQARLGEQFPPDMQSRLASAYFNQGVALSAQGEKAAASESYGRAIAFWETLQARLGEEFTPDMQDSLANVYFNQGNALSARGDQAAASESYGRAIAFWEALQARLGEEFTPDMQDSLAIVYSNQGNALWSRGDQAAALGSIGRAIALWEILQARLGEQFPPDMQDRLASVCARRGMALSAQGDQAAAFASIGRAVAVWEALQARLGEQFPPERRNVLAALQEALKTSRSSTRRVH